MDSPHAVVRQLCGLVFAAFACTGTVPNVYIVASALHTKTRTAVHLPLFKEEGVVGVLLAIRWSTGERQLRDYIDIALPLLRPLGMDPPSLVELCAYRLRANSTGSVRGERARAGGEVEARLPRELQERFAFGVPV
jgi:hypothetical protein